MNRQYRNSPSDNAGFTLIEMLITVTVMGIIAAMAAPSMQHQINQARIQSGASMLADATKTARTQALISQRDTQMVLDMADTTQDTTITLSYVPMTAGATAETFATYRLDKALTVTSNPATLTTVSFTPNKQVFQGAVADKVAMTANTGFSLCRGSGTTKYEVNIDGNGNVMTIKSGSCP